MSPSAAPISVVIPAYNAAAFIAEALESAFGQTLPPGEVVVVDDGSSDETAAIAERFGARVIRQENRGLSAARNAGIRAARHEWIALLDADDTWEATKLEEQWAALQCCPEAHMAVTDHMKIEDGAVVQPSFLAQPEVDYARRKRLHPAPDVACFPRIDEDFWGVGDFLVPSAVLVRRETILMVGLFDEDLRFSEDIECFTRVLARSALVVVERPLMRYRLHAGNHSKNELEMTLCAIRITERMLHAPHEYPPGAGAAWAATLPERQAAAGRLLLETGRAREGRRLLGASLRHRPTLRTLALFVVSLLGGFGLRQLLALKRARPRTSTG